MASRIYQCHELQLIFLESIFRPRVFGSDFFVHTAKMSALASNEAPIIAQAQVDRAALAGTAMEKHLGRGSVDDTSLTSSDDDVTDDDLQNLRRVSGKIPWAAFTVAFVELCERFSYYGTTVVCVWRSLLLSNEDF